MMNQVPSANPDAQKVGLPCPRCGGFIPTTIFQLLTSRVLFCPHCRLELRIDPAKSRLALDVLRKVQCAQKNLDERSHFYR